jgi:hypothetical protein
MSGFGGGREKDAFDKYAIVIDPQIPDVAQRKLRGEGPAGQSGRGKPQPATGVALVRFRDPKPQVPLPRRPLTAAQWLWIAAGVLGVVAALGGLFGNMGSFLLFGVLAIAAGGVGWVTAHGNRPALSAGGRDDPRLSGWYLTHAEKIFHRQYVMPRTDLDVEARMAWNRAVTAANRIYRSQVLRAQVIDAAQVRATVPEQLWKIAEGLAQISEVRYHHSDILGRSPIQSAVISGKVAEQERQLSRGTRRVNQRIGRLEDFAGLLDQADAFRHGETMLDRLSEVDGLLRDLLATTEETAVDIDVAQRLEIEAQAIIDQTEAAISHLAGPYDEDDPSDAEDPEGAQVTGVADRQVNGDMRGSKDAEKQKSGDGGTVPDDPSCLPDRLLGDIRRGTASRSQLTSWLPS